MPATLCAAPGTVLLYSDIGCPWAHLVVHRLLTARARPGRRMADVAGRPGHMAGDDAACAGGGPGGQGPRAEGQRAAGPRPAGRLLRSESLRLHAPRDPR